MKTLVAHRGFRCCVHQNGPILTRTRDTTNSHIPFFLILEPGATGKRCAKDMILTILCLFTRPINIAVIYPRAIRFSELTAKM